MTILISLLPETTVNPFNILDFFSGLLEGGDVKQSFKDEEKKFFNGAKDDKGYPEERGVQQDEEQIKDRGLGYAAWLVQEQNNDFR